MTSFLSKKKDEKTYEENIATIPEQTRRNKMYAIKVFENFVKDSYDRSIQYKDAINSGAEIADISVETAKRHLKRVISSEGKFRKHDYDDDRPSVLTKRDPPRGVKEKLFQNIVGNNQMLS